MMHELVKRPLNASMEEVGDSHLDNMGISNLRVPLDVGEARDCADNSGAYTRVGQLQGDAHTQALASKSGSEGSARRWRERE